MGMLERFCLVLVLGRLQQSCACLLDSNWNGHRLPLGLACVEDLRSYTSVSPRNNFAPRV